jgi:hypothetical protein
VPWLEHAIPRNRRRHRPLSHDELPALEPIDRVLDGSLRETGGSFQGISFAADDVAKTHDELKARGAEFAQGPTKQDWGTFAILKDIDGNQFVLSSK